MITIIRTVEDFIRCDTQLHSNYVNVRETGAVVAGIQRRQAVLL